jgi:predicted kinase
MTQQPSNPKPINRLKPKFILCQGISASGKSTYARKLLENDPWWTELNRDRWRFALFAGGTEDWGLYKFSKANEDKVSEFIKKDWLSAVARGDNVVCSDTNLSQKYVDQWRKEAETYGYDFQVLQFPVTLDEALKRDERRPNSVGSKVIVEQYKRWLKLTNRVAYVPNENLPECILVDIDGTGPFEWLKVGVDSPRQFVLDIIEAYQTRYPSVATVLLSGRDSKARAETERWLIQHEIAYDELYMRWSQDQRKDSIIKEELFWDLVAPQFHVLFVVDDRPQVVRMWKDLGLSVVDVSESYGEF